MKPARRIRGIATAACVALAAGAGPARAGSVALRWNPLDDPAVARYGVHHGPAPGRYDGVVWTTATATVVDGLDDCRERSFAIRAYDESGSPVGRMSSEIVGWPRPRIEGVFPEVLQAGAAFDVYVVGANFRPGAILEFDTPGIAVRSVDVRDCRHLLVRLDVAGGAPAGDLQLHVVNPDRTFGTRVVAVTGTMTVPTGVDGIRRDDAVPGGDDGRR